MENKNIKQTLIDLINNVKQDFSNKAPDYVILYQGRPYISWTDSFCKRVMFNSKFSDVNNLTEYGLLLMLYVHHHELYHAVNQESSYYSYRTFDLADKYAVEQMMETPCEGALKKSISEFLKNIMDSKF